MSVNIENMEPTKKNKKIKFNVIPKKKYSIVETFVKNEKKHNILVKYV